MTLELAVLRESVVADLPGDNAFETWVTAALGGRSAGLALRIVDEDESRQLNARYRGKDKATNVLSFPADLPAAVAEALPVPPLGDLALCAPLVAREASAQGKPERNHWAHLTVHGVLHLLGHDHEDAADAERMETLERELLAGLGIPDPYVL